MKEQHVCILGVVLGIGILLTIILVPLSFQYVERNRLGFKKNTATNDVDRSKVYTPGRYFWGLGRTAVEFPSSLQSITFTGWRDRLSVFADSGQTLYIEVRFYYRVIREKLPMLFDEYGQAFHSRIVTISAAQIRNAAIQFPVEEYVTNRNNVTSGIFQRVHDELLDKMYVEVPRQYFLLQQVTLPDSVLDQKTQIFETNQVQLTNSFKFSGAVIRLETQANVTRLENQAQITRLNATNVASRLRQDARSRAFSDVEQEKGKQLAFMVNHLGVTGVNRTTQLLLLNTLLDTDNEITLLSGVNGAILQSP